MMKIIVVKTQADLDILPERFAEYTRIEIRASVRIIVGEARENSSVVALGNSSVEALGNSSVEARGNSSVVARGNSSVVALENSSVVALENSSVEVWENSSVVARGNSSVVAWGQSIVRTVSAGIKLALHGFSILFIPVSLDLKFTCEKTCAIQRYEPLRYLDREGVPVENNEVILYKRVSADYKTQEGTKNETLWEIGRIVTHPLWNPAKSECGEGKFHACSRPYFCDEFRSKKNDRYIAIGIKIDDLYEWEECQEYPHKVAFREGHVLFECDKRGNKLTE